MDEMRHHHGGNRGSEKRLNHFTTTYAIEQFSTAIHASLGYAPPEIIFDGNLHRFKDPRNKLNGWYKLHLDGVPAGAFGDWKQGVSQKWKIDGVTCSLSIEERAAIKAAQLQRAKDQAEQEREAAQRALQIWQSAKPAPTEHPYLLKKTVMPHIARIDKHNNLILPVGNAKGLSSLQFISPNGDKRFLKNGVKRSCYAVIEGFTNLILICEGFATGASLHEKSGSSVVIAFDAGNLQPVAEVIRATYPKARLMLCADNDPHGKGEKCARAAALAVGCSYIIPSNVGTDFNDVLTGGDNEA